MKQSVISVALKTPLKQDWECVFTKLHFRISPMTLLVLHHATACAHKMLNSSVSILHAQRILY